MASAAPDKLLAGVAQPGFNAWAVCAVPVALFIHVAAFRKESVQSRMWLLLPASLVGACVVWLSAVTSTVPEPYLDEVFHIPQAQRYCDGKFREWDDKITTPPGLYLLSVLPQAARLIGLDWAYHCDTNSLRAVNAVGLFVLAYLALLCRRQIEAQLREARVPTQEKPLSEYALHTSCNIAFFPLLFFFSALYYTDVISTAVVIGAFLNHLHRVGRGRSALTSDMLTIGLGILALLMRQTNVFWIVVYMGGLEAVHAVKTLRPERVDLPLMTTLWEQLKYFAWRYSVGDIHDLTLSQAWPDDMFFTAVSLVLAVSCNPSRVLRQTWPYVAVLAVFAAFVAWNKGVVLGDKSNHVATIHLAQMFYIWPLLSFFSLPLLVPYVLAAVNVLTAGATAACPTNPPSAGTKSSRASGPSRRCGNSKSQQAEGGDSGPRPGPVGSPNSVSRALRIARQSKAFVWLLYLLSTVVLSYVVVRYNTIVHPFTLADNRHYMFYVFRYTIRRAKWMRYLLVVPYTISRWLVWGAMAGSGVWMADPQGVCPPSTSHAFRIAYGKRQTEAPWPGSSSQEALGVGAREDGAVARRMSDEPLSYSAEPASTSTGLMWLLATALSLVTAPLVEPRYFIIPWVMWRLLVPAWRLDGGALGSVSAESRAGKVVGVLRRHDLRLVLETVWFAAINLVTCYIFLAKPYVWRAEDGSVLDDGRLQRFMW